MAESAARSGVCFAISKAGHDKGTWYCIIGETSDAYFVSDGNTRTVERPKRKNKKHVQVVANIPAPLQKMCRQNGVFYNEGIKRALKIRKREEL